MPTAHSDHLFQLIKSLTKAEKRNFKLFAGRSSKNDQKSFVSLFDVIDKVNNYDEEKIFKRSAFANKQNLTNAKRHLYSQILKSLRLIHSQKDIDVHIRELIDSASILYAKGLYLQALKILDRAKTVAQKANQEFLLMEIYEHEKQIESRHITRSRKVENKIEQLIKASRRVNKVINSSSELLNLNLKIHGLYIKIGFVKNEKDDYFVRSYFYSNLPNYKLYKITFFERIYLLQSFVWYHYTCLNFTRAYHNAFKWVNLFRSKSYMIEKDPDLYMRGLHYVLLTCFYMRYYRQFENYFEILEQFYKERKSSFNRTSELIYFIYGYNAMLNKHFLEGTFTAAKERIPEMEKELLRFDKIIDHHRKIMFSYKLAWLYFALSEYNNALDQLNKIHNLKKNYLRVDVECYTKLFILICHLELQEYILVNNLISSTQRYFKNKDETTPVIAMIFEYIKKRLLIKKELPKKELIILYDKLIILRGNKFTQRAFFYFNFTAWIKSKIEDRSISEIRKEHFKNYRR